MVFTCYTTFDTDVWVDDAAKDNLYIISKSAKTGLIMSKGRNSSVKKMFFFSFWYSRPKATWSLKFIVTTPTLQLTYLGNNAHFFIVKLNSMFYQDWFDHVKEEKFIGQENVSLIMILKITGPVLRPLILCLKLSTEKTKNKKTLKDFIAT